MRNGIGGGERRSGTQPYRIAHACETLISLETSPYGTKISHMANHVKRKMKTERVNYIQMANIRTKIMTYIVRLERSSRATAHHARAIERRDGLRWGI